MKRQSIMSTADTLTVFPDSPQWRPRGAAGLGRPRVRHCPGRRRSELVQGQWRAARPALVSGRVHLHRAAVGRPATRPKGRPSVQLAGAAVRLAELELAARPAAVLLALRRLGLRARQGPTAGLV